MSKEIGKGLVAIVLTVVMGIFAGSVVGESSETGLCTVEVKGHFDRFKGESKFKILEMKMNEDLVHYQGTDKIKFNFSIKYDVLQPAPIYLTSQKGLGYQWDGWNLGYEPEWRIYNYTNPTMPQVYSKEKIDLSEKGVQECLVPVYDSDQIRGGPIFKGTNSVIGQYWSFYIVDKKTDKYLDYFTFLKQKSSQLFINFNRVKRFARNLTFCVANLNKFRLWITDFKSNWEEGGFITLRVKIEDGDGEVFDLPQAHLTATFIAGKTRKDVRLEPVFKWDNITATYIPQGYFKAAIPSWINPNEIDVKGYVVALTPDGKKIKKIISRSFKKTEGLKETIKEETITLAGKERKAVFIRDKNGVIRETRAMYVWGRTLKSKEFIDTMLKNIKEANFNVIIPDIRINKDGKWALYHPNPSFDNLAYLIEKAHLSGIEVHPYLSVFVWASNCPMEDRRVNEKGESMVREGCSHNPEVRKLVTQNLRKLVSKYDIDGIVWDYIRTSSRKCFCKYCQQEFKRKFGKSLADAASDDWINWQIEGVGKMVEEISQGIKSVKPKIIVSAWCITPQRRGGQRGWQWINKGYLDTTHQDMYYYDTQTRIGYFLNHILKAKDKSKVYSCLGVFTRFFGKGGNCP